MSTLDFRARPGSRPVGPTVAGDKIAIALHDFASVQDPDVVVFDYADGPNGVRGHLGATAFPSMLAMAASFDRDWRRRTGWPWRRRRWPPVGT